MPSVPIEAVVKVGEHLASVLGLGQLVFEAARVQWNDGGRDSQFVSPRLMGVIGVVSRVREYAVKRDVLGSLGHGRFEERYVVTGAAGHDGTCK